MAGGRKKGFMGTLAERFEKNTQPEPNSGCLLWLGATRGKDGNSYGVIRDDGRPTVATHVALKLAGIEVPTGKCALHRCDNTFCVNADHLFVGTNKENVADAVAKGRRKPWIGTNNPKAKLSAEQIERLAARALAGERTRVLTRDFQICPQVVHQIRRRAAAA